MKALQYLGQPRLYPALELGSGKVVRTNEVVEVSDAKAESLLQSKDLWKLAKTKKETG